MRPRTCSLRCWRTWQQVCTDTQSTDVTLKSVPIIFLYLKFYNFELLVVLFCWLKLHDPVYVHNETVNVLKMWKLLFFLYRYRIWNQSVHGSLHRNCKAIQSGWLPDTRVHFWKTVQHNLPCKLPFLSIVATINIKVEKKKKIFSINHFRIEK